MITKFHTLNYAQAAGVIPTLTQFLSPRGKIIQDDRTNTLIISEIETEWVMAGRHPGPVGPQGEAGEHRGADRAGQPRLCSLLRYPAQLSTSNASGGTTVSGDVLTPNPGTANASVFIVNSGVNYLVDAC